MTATQLDELQKSKMGIRPLTIEQYHRMAETGILQSGEPIELLNGVIVYKDRSAVGAPPMTVNPSHSFAIDQITELCQPLKRRGFRIRVQQPISLPPGSEPEPDVAIAHGKARDFAKRHPSPSEVPCVFEVADSSLPRDRTTKLEAYARSGIPTYVIVNLIDSVVEVYTNPIPDEGRFEELHTFARGSSLSLRISNRISLDLQVDEIIA
jgi:Uma2 family endonuclease